MLAGGVPLNDPFGGWVYWGRVPQAAIERIEVVRGGLSDLYGADAVGRRHPHRAVRRDAGRQRARIGRSGSLDTNRVSLFAGTAFGPGRRGRARVAGNGRARCWRFNAAVERLSTEGAPIVAEEVRGPIDTPAGVTHSTLFASVGMQPARGPADRRCAVRCFSEDRENGTPLQTNDTNQRQIAGARAGRCVAAARGRRTSIAARRATISRSRAVAAGARQRIADAASARAERHARRQRRMAPRVVAHGRARPAPRRVRVDGRTHGNALRQRHAAAADIGGRRTADGRRLHAGDDRRDVAAVASSAACASITGRTRVEFSGDSQSLTPVSPRVAASCRAASDVTVRGTVYRAFRAPTLNELYRNFRAGDALTLANEDLEAESLTGGEVSLLWTPARHHRARHAVLHRAGRCDRQRHADGDADVDHASAAECGIGARARRRAGSASGV